MNLMLENVPQELVKYLTNKKFAEVAVRDGKKRFQHFYKLAVNKVKETKSTANTAMMSTFGIAMEAANLLATIVGTVIICDKLNNMSKQLDEIRKGLEQLKDIQLKTTVLQSDILLVENYKIYSDNLKKGIPIPKKEMITFIRDCNRNINLWASINEETNLETVLGEIFVLLPMMCNYILLYYKTYYSAEEGLYVLHDEWIYTLEKLSSDEFMNKIQDYFFIDKCMTNKEVNQYLVNHRYIIAEYKQQIEQLAEDLKTCGSVEEYEEAMQWSRQYALQQMKACQPQLEEEYGKEKAEEIMTAAMEGINA